MLSMCTCICNLWTLLYFYINKMYVFSTNLLKQKKTKHILVFLKHLNVHTIYDICIDIYNCIFFITKKRKREQS